MAAPMSISFTNHEFLTYQCQETANDTTPQVEIDVTASVSEPNHENISENMLNLRPEW
jgi:hypothetical protein